jgi:hypothetical protein
VKTIRSTGAVLLLVSSLVIGLAGAAAASNTDPTKAGAAWLTALFATGSANDAQAALPLVAPNSPAYAYTVFQIGGLKALAGSGAGSTPTAVKPKGKNVTLCQTALNGSTCVTVGRFMLDKKGRVRTFSYFYGGPPTPLGPPVLGTGQTGSGFGVNFQLASYFRARDGLIVILNVTGAPDGARTIQAYQATYQPPTGPPVQAATSRGIASDIQPNVAATLELQFAGNPTPGGTITIPMMSGQPDYTNGSAKLQIP